MDPKYDLVRPISESQDEKTNYQMMNPYFKPSFVQHCIEPAYFNGIVILHCNRLRSHLLRMKPTVDCALSVVIPVRNSAHQLKLCLEALLLNDLRGVEILVVDDCSSEDLNAIISDLPKPEGVVIQYLRLRCRSGPAGARNEGLKCAQLPYVLFLDADVVLPAQGLVWVRETFARHSGRPEIVGLTGVYSENQPSPDFLTNFKNLNVCFLQRTSPIISPFVHSAIFCIKKDVLLSLGGFSTQMETAEDFCLGITLGTRGLLCVSDARIQGIHLKPYSLIGILREDRRRIRDLLNIDLNPEQRRIYYQAHRLDRILSLAIPGPALIFLMLGLGNRACALLGIALFMVFCCLNIPFLRYVRRLRGVLFAVLSAGFLFFEMIWAEIVLVFSFLEKATGQDRKRKVG